MDDRQERPVPGAPPNVDQPQEVLRYLLEAEVDRLGTALRIERERRIVFPETSVIIRDILKLLAAVYPAQAVTTTLDDDGGLPDPSL